MLKPEEIMVPEFSKGFKGYTPQEVDNFINQLLTEYRELYFKYTETEEKLETVVEKYKQTSARATEAMNGVKQMSEAIITDAQEKAEKIIAEANAKSDAVTGAMKESCGSVLSSYAAAFEEEKQRFLIFEEKSRLFREALLEAYKTHVSDIQSCFPAISQEELDSINYESEVSGAFKANLRNLNSEE